MLVSEHLVHRNYLNWGWVIRSAVEVLEVTKSQLLLEFSFYTHLFLPLSATLFYFSDSIQVSKLRHSFRTFQNFKKAGSSLPSCQYGSSDMIR